MLGDRERLVSLDAYRGFIMLMMVSAGFAIARTLDGPHGDTIMAMRDGTTAASQWRQMWETLAYQFSHVQWTGCAFWDLIQPSFMFMVGAAIPFSYIRRVDAGQGIIGRTWHVLIRAIVLVVLGVFLHSQSSKVAKFDFTNVLTQIGLGYIFVYIFLKRSTWTILFAIALILGGYGFFFYQHQISDAELTNVKGYLAEQLNRGEEEVSQFSGAPANKWNKHTNAAASFDRDVLNRLPRNEEPWREQRYWVNAGGYQLLNFVPSIATMLFGLIAGQWLVEYYSKGKKLRLLLIAALACFVVSMACDTTIWPKHWGSNWPPVLANADWTVCPIVKRIWTPTWAVFSAGWAFLMLAGFFFAIEICRLKWLAFPFTVVGMNSIAMYCMSQLIKPWIGRMLKMVTATVDSAFATNSAYYLFDANYEFSAICLSAATLGVLWLICLWLYRKRIFIRI